MPLTRAAIFHAYNLARHAARSNKRIEMKRLNRALGLLLSGKWEEKVQEYHTEPGKCYCMDSYREGVWCKHRLALMLKYRAEHPLSRECIRELRIAEEDMKHGLPG